MKTASLIYLGKPNIILAPENAEDKKLIDLISAEQIFAVKRATTIDLTTMHSINVYGRQGNPLVLSSYTPLTDKDMEQRFKEGALAFKEFCIENKSKKTLDQKYDDWINEKFPF